MVLLAAVWGQNQAAELPRWKSLFRQGLSAWERDDSEYAHFLLSEAYRIAPEGKPRAQIALKQGNLYAHEGEKHSAAKWWRQVLAHDPKGEFGQMAHKQLKSLPREPAPAPSSATYSVPDYTAPPPSTFLPKEWYQPVEIPWKEVAFFFPASFLLLLGLLRWWGGRERSQPAMQVSLSLLLSLGLTMVALFVFLLLSQRLVLDASAGVAALLTLLSVLCLAYASRMWQQGQLLRGTPITRLRSAAHGFVKVRGRALARFGTLSSQTGGVSAIYLDETTEQYVRREERYYDSQEKQWKTRTIRRWETVYSNTEKIDFVLNDGTGCATVEVERAEFHPDHVALFYNGSPARGFPWFASVGDLRTTVRYIPPDAQVTVWARYCEHDLPGTDEKRLGYDSFYKCMIVLEGNESRAYSGRTWSGCFLALLGILMALVLVGGLLFPAEIERLLRRF